jgi:hypothetical protein
MNRYFSRGGARRGLVLAALAALLWACWAVVYWQALTGAEAPALPLFSI